jgi:hypothetical protein
VVCTDQELHRERVEARGRKLAHLAEPTWHAVEQSLDEWEDWSGPSATVARITVDSSGPLGANVDRALAFLEPAVD